MGGTRDEYGGYVPQLAGRYDPNPARFRPNQFPPYALPPHVQPAHTPHEERPRFVSQHAPPQQLYPPPQWQPAPGPRGGLAFGAGRGDETAPYADNYHGRQGEGGLWTLPDQRATHPRPHPPAPKGVAGDELYSKRHAFLKAVPARDIFHSALPNDRPLAPARHARETNPTEPVYGRFHGDVLGGVDVRDPPGAMARAANAAAAADGGCGCSHQDGASAGGYGAGRGGYVPSTMRNDDISGPRPGPMPRCAHAAPLARTLPSPPKTHYTHAHLFGLPPRPPPRLCDPPASTCRHLGRLSALGAPPCGHVHSPVEQPRRH